MAGLKSQEFVYYITNIDKDKSKRKCLVNEGRKLSNGVDTLVFDKVKLPATKIILVGR